MVLPKYLFCRVGWMENYEGLDNGDRIRGGGSYVDEYGIGSEIHNFTVEEIPGSFLGDFVAAKEKNEIIPMHFGFVMYHGQIEISRLDAGIHDDYVDDVTVFWIAPPPTPDKSDARLIGWYKNARVFRHHEDFEVDYPLIRDEEGCWCNIMARARDGVLLPVDERKVIIPRAKGVGGSINGGIGQSNVWYARGVNDVTTIKYAFNAIRRYEGLL